MASRRMLSTEVDESHDQILPPEALPTAQGLAARVCLTAWPEPLRARRAGHPLVFTDRFEMESWTNRELRGPEGVNIAVWPARSMSEASKGVARISEACSPRARWSFLEDPFTREDPEDGEMIVLFASPVPAELPQAVMAFRRHATVSCEPKGFELSVNLKAEFVFTLPSARRRNLGAALAATAGMCLDADIRRIARAWRSAGSPGPITVFVSGDAYSKGGERTFKSLLSCAQFAADELGGVDISAEADWSV